MKIVSIDVRILRNSDFRRLWVSGAISGIGSWLLVVAIPVHVFQLTGSATATGLTVALEAVPALIVGPWAGVLLDRWNLSRAMWLADLASAAAVALILFADSADRIWLVYVAVLAENLATTVFRPAARALTPAVVGTGDELAAANSLSAFSGSVIRLTTPPLGALLLTGPGITFVLIVDIVSYLLSAAVIASVSHRRLTPNPQAGKGFQALREGLRGVVRNKILSGILIANGVFLTANAGATALLVPFTVERLDAPGPTVGYLISGLGAGFLLGAALSPKALTWLNIRDLLIVTQTAVGAAFFALFNAPTVPWAIAATALIGFPGSILLITAETTVQRVAPTELLGRIGSLFFAMDSLTVVIGALTAPALTKLAGLPLTLNLIAAFAVLAAPVTFVAVPSHPAGLTRSRHYTV
ncbi:MFS transporter [Kribbella sp. NPDC051620]|uniref:MFS transporter n=1 Tax=Kribbella sp. NPDC051620 TaxID=3364120 RepID=UPI0037A1E231